MPRSLSGFPAIPFGAEIVTALASGSTFVLSRELYCNVKKREGEREGRRENSRRRGRRMREKEKEREREEEGEERRKRRERGIT